MPSYLLQTSLLILSVLFSYLWSVTPALNIYTLQLIGATVLLYFVSRVRSMSKLSFIFTAAVINIICLLVIFSTGGLSSPVFFILDFLIFAIALIQGPFQAGAVSAALIVLLFVTGYPQLSSQDIISLLSLLLITPLAITFSNIYLRNLESIGRITVLREAVKDEQTENLLWITTSAKPSLSGILNSLTDIIVYLNARGPNVVLPAKLLEKLKMIQTDLIGLYSSAGTLEKSIKDSSDKMEL